MKVITWNPTTTPHRFCIIPNHVPRGKLPSEADFESAAWVELPGKQVCVHNLRTWIADGPIPSTVVDPYPAGHPLLRTAVFDVDATVYDDRQGELREDLTAYICADEHQMRPATQPGYRQALNRLHITTLSVCGSPTNLVVAIGHPPARGQGRPHSWYHGQ
jgi:hypothetical protein